MDRNNISWTNKGFEYISAVPASNNDNQEITSRLLVRAGNNCTIVDYWLSDNIEEMSKYIDLLKAIEVLGDNDEINLHINCYGGFIDTANQIRTALASSKANLRVSVEGMCASAATFFFTVADEITLAPNTIFMLHSYSGGSYGKFHEQMAQADFMKKWFGEFVRDVYKDLLSETEIACLLDGKDLYFTKDEFLPHIANMIKAKQDAVAEEDKMFEELAIEMERVQTEFLNKYKKKKNAQSKNTDDDEQNESPKKNPRKKSVKIEEEEDVDAESPKKNSRKKK